MYKIKFVTSPERRKWDDFYLLGVLHFGSSILYYSIIPVLRSMQKWSIMVARTLLETISCRAILNSAPSFQITPIILSAQFLRAVRACPSTHSVYAHVRTNLTPNCASDSTKSIHLSLLLRPQLWLICIRRRPVPSLKLFASHWNTHSRSLARPTHRP